MASNPAVRVPRATGVAYRVAHHMQRWRVEAAVFTSLRFHDARTAAVVLWVAAGAIVGAAADARGQSTSDADPPLVLEVARRVACDPTTYAPTIVVHTARQLDWSSSQPLFALGYLEANPRYTVSGRPDDVPVSYAAGNRRIARDTVGLLGWSAANNAVSAVVERRLIARAPRHRRLIRTIGWIERVSFAAYWSHRLSRRHVEQWRANRDLARELGVP
jgi:hypothetical protein